LDLTAWVAVVSAPADPEICAAVDPGIIHPLVVAAGDRALLVSGRAVRAEEFLHLEDAKVRDRRQATKRGRGEPGPAVGASRAPGRSTERPTVARCNSKPAAQRGLA
jgi:hypothetical protein